MSSHVCRVVNVVSVVSVVSPTHLHNRQTRHDTTLGVPYAYVRTFAYLRYVSLRTYVRGLPRSATRTYFFGYPWYKQNVKANFELRDFLNDADSRIFSDAEDFRRFHERKSFFLIFFKLRKLSIFFNIKHPLFCSLKPCNLHLFR